MITIIMLVTMIIIRLNNNNNLDVYNSNHINSNMEWSILLCLQAWASRANLSTLADGFQGFLLSMLAAHLAQQGKLVSFSELVGQFANLKASLQSDSVVGQFALVKPSLQSQSAATFVSCMEAHAILRRVKAAQGCFAPSSCNCFAWRHDCISAATLRKRLLS